MPIAKSVVCGTNSLTFSFANPNSELVKILMSSIKEVHVFKRDLFGYDLICLSIITNSGFESEIDEECSGWRDLLTSLEKSLPNFPSSNTWWKDVAFPAFETNHKALYIA